MRSYKFFALHLYSISPVNYEQRVPEVSILPLKLRPTHVLCAFVVVFILYFSTAPLKGQPICLPPWPFIIIWHRQVCWVLQESAVSTAAAKAGMYT